MQFIIFIFSCSEFVLITSGVKTIQLFIGFDFWPVVYRILYVRVHVHLHFYRSVREQTVMRKTYFFLALMQVLLPSVGLTRFVRPATCTHKHTTHTHHCLYVIDNSECDSNLYMHSSLPATPPCHTPLSHLLATPPCHTSLSHLLATPLPSILNIPLLCLPNNFPCLPNNHPVLFLPFTPTHHTLHTNTPYPPHPPLFLTTSLSHSFRLNKS